MVNVMVANNTPNAPAEKPAKRNVGGKKILLIVLPAAIIIIAGSFLYLNSVHASCSDLVKQSNNDVSQIHSLNSVKSAYNNLSSHSSSCKSKGFLGLGSTSNSPSQADQFQFYYNKAITGYDLGKRDEAKQNALKALAIGNELSASDKKKISNYNDMVLSLGYVRDGNY
jgi:uncharacterized protein YxeA